MDEQALQTGLEGYVKHVGVKASFNLFAYNSASAACGADGSSLVKNALFLKTILLVPLVL